MRRDSVGFRTLNLACQKRHAESELGPVSRLDASTKAAEIVSLDPKALKTQLEVTGSPPPLRSMPLKQASAIHLPPVPSTSLAYVPRVDGHCGALHLPCHPFFLRSSRSGLLQGCTHASNPFSEPVGLWVQSWGVQVLSAPG